MTSAPVGVHLVYGNSFSGNNHFVFTLGLDVEQKGLLLDNGLKLFNFKANLYSKL